ncbi:hypothetical protein [Enterovirga aerilata]|uniref:Uncharacterized protein n=1 Tax=Enterovirga aerilata TaxID=2730920 RepID=A0A849I875_9HYPH|nr:hypothetical protein [Enterovirga sp. DB1703]NNM73984.1 hypothetical protein [Enterovirga sp. DB1703]
MTAIIKRKLGETWRDAVAGRLASAAPDRLPEGLATFDAAVRAGKAEVEAAYAVLADRNLLWHVDAPGFSAASPAAEAQDPHSVPRI